MRSKVQKKNLFKGIVITSIVVIGILLEIFVFNFKYFTLSQEEKGVQKVDLDTILYNDIDRDGENLKITGDNPYFEIQGDKNISYLKIKLVEKSNKFNLITVKDGIEIKTYDSNSGYKDYSYLDVNEKSDNVIFKVRFDKVKEDTEDTKVLVDIEEIEAAKVAKDVENIGIDEIFIDNTFTFNWIRLILIVSIALVVAFFVLYRDIAKEKLHITFIVIALGIGINISIMTPPYRTYDEREHFVKAYEIANLDLGLGFHPNVEWVDNMDNFFAANGGKVFQSYKERVAFTQRFSNNNYVNVKRYGTTASTYLFLAYIPSALGIAIGKILSLPFIMTFYLGRIMSLITFSLIGFFAIKHIKIAKRLLFMILLLPSVIYTAGSYSADGVTLGFSVLCITMFINMLANTEKSIKLKELGYFVLCVAILTISKVSYAPFCLLILAVPNSRFQKKSTAIYSKLSFLGITGMFAGGTLLYASLKNLEQWSMPNVSVSGQINYIIGNLFTYIDTIISSFFSNVFMYLSGTFGQLAYSYEFKPMYVICMCVALVVVAIIDNESDVLQLNGKDKLMIALLVIFSWGLIVTALYLTFTPVGSNYIDGLQGRYIIPLLVPMLLLLKNNKVISNFSKRELNYIISISFLCILLFACLKLIQFYNV